MILSQLRTSIHSTQNYLQSSDFYPSELHKWSTERQEFSNLQLCKSHRLLDTSDIPFLKCAFAQRMASECGNWSTDIVRQIRWSYSTICSVARRHGFAFHSCQKLAQEKARREIRIGIFSKWDNAGYPSLTLAKSSLKISPLSMRKKRDC